MNNRVVVIAFKDDKEFDEIIGDVRNIFIENDSVVVYAAVDFKADEVVAIFDEEPESESGLVAHAKRELELINEEPETISWYLKVIQAFADYGHSGGSASVSIPVINELLQFHPLSGLTDDPEEWMFVAEDVWGEEGGIWQSRRRPDAFSNDGGKTYYLLDEGGNDKHREPLHESEKKNK